MPEKERSLRTSRRGVLSAFTGTGVAAVLGEIASNPVAATTATDSTDAISLGTFESTLDNWQTNSDIALSRVSRHNRPVCVTEGEYALNATVNGDPAPTISRSVADLNFSRYPYFVADAAPSRIEGTDASISFQFRLYRLADILDDGSALKLVAESDPVTVPQATPGRLFWDASNVEPDLLDVVARLEIGWYPADRDRDSTDGTFAYRGEIVFDSIRATDSVDPVGSARLATTMRELQFDHGAYVRTEVTEEFSAGEVGTFVFADGATEPYRFEILATDQFRLTVAGTEIKLGGGWS